MEISSQGYSIRWKSDDSVVRSGLEGKENTWSADGSRSFLHPNGVSMTNNPDGTALYTFPDGTNISQEKSSGSDYWIDFTFDLAENSQIATLSANENILTIEMSEELANMLCTAAPMKMLKKSIAQVSLR